MMEDKRISAIIVDDEERARNVLRMSLEENCPEVEIIDLLPDVPKAVASINKFKPDLVFLDVEMPGYSGLQLLDFFEKPEFGIIFTTAYSDYAIQAIKASAIDYLLKPIQEHELKDAVQKATNSLKVNQQGERYESLKENMTNEGEPIKKLAIPTSYGFMLVDVTDLLYLEADGSYTNVYLANGQKLLISRKLKEFEYLIEMPFFFKSHRSYIINLHSVKMYYRNDGGFIIMNNDAKVGLSRDKKEEFLAALKSSGIN